VILCVSTSSPVVSLALVREGEVLASRRREASRGSGGVVLDLLSEALRETQVGLESVRLFVADVGPGGFTGVRVGVALAKAWAWSMGCRCAGVSAFDLIAADRTVAIPVRRGLFLVRRPGSAPERADQPPQGAFGYGDAFDPQRHPDASRCAELIHLLEPVEPHRLLPAYGAEPSISVPKMPYGLVGGSGA